MIFLGWHQPLLHAATDWLLETANIPAAPDLSSVLIAVQGRRAGRRLLELLALKCSEAGAILIPPEIVTASSLVRRLTRPVANELESASPLACALAWAQAIGDLDPDRQVQLFRRPGTDEAGLGTRLGLGRQLHQIWSEIGGAGLIYRDVIRTLDERFPHIAEFEIPRWEVLETLHTDAGEILHALGLRDPTDALVVRARRGEIVTGRTVVLVGMADMPHVVRDFLARLPECPQALVFAPETQAEGFDEYGLLRPPHWKKRPAGLEAGQIHRVERDRDQALRTAQVIKSWHDGGIELDRMTVAVPDATALPRLREALETEGFETRWAQGRPLSDAPAFQLLKFVAAYLDHGPDEPPRYDAVAALVRHPDVPGLRPASWSALDRYATTHLPARFDPRGVAGASEQVVQLQQIVERFVDLAVDKVEPVRMADWTLRFLLRIYGERQERANSPEGRVAVQAFQVLRELLADTTEGRLPWPPLVRPADFLAIVLAFLGEQPVPEPSAAGAIQLVGWLELIDDDTPAVVVASFFEGAVPESISSDLFLPGALREALGLTDNAMRFARDAYALAAIVQSRPPGRGAVALVAPRFDSAENPVRPSRLLLAGLRAENLARRVWHLAGKRPPEPQLPLSGGIGLTAAALKIHPPIESVRATAFRTYIESPRKFYFQNVLGLRAENDAFSELGAADVGTLIHLVLAGFGEDAGIRESSDEAAIRNFVFARFDQIVAERFGRWAQPAVEIQMEEVRRRLGGFVRAQASLRRQGWIIRYVEGRTRLEGEIVTDAPPGSLRLTGKIDRIDYLAAEQRWRIIDYKTSAKGHEPLIEHRRKNGEWRDLQLPLYLKLAAPHAQAEWGVELTPENCELTYFLLPEEEGAARISMPFPAEMVGEAWTEAAHLAGRMLRGEFEENPPLDPSRNDVALLALCGQVGIVSPEVDNVESEA